MIDKSKIFYEFLLAFVIGIIAAAFVFEKYSFLEFWFFVAGVLLLFLAIIFCWFTSENGNTGRCQNWQHRALPCVCFGFVFFGMWWYFLGLGESLGVSRYNGRELALEGRVVSEVISKINYQKFELGELAVESEVETGKVLVYTSVFPTVAYGDKLNLNCNLQKVDMIEDFDYPAFLARQGIFSLCFYPDFEVLDRSKNDLRFYLYKFKSKLSNTMKLGLKKPASGIARAMLLGEKHALDPGVRESFSRVGLSHIIAISGMHITIWGGMIFWLLIQLGLGRKSNFFVLAFVLFFYLALIGFPSSAIRAYVMLLILALAFLSGRLVRLERVLLLAAFLILVWSPRSIEDIGFQLSFLAVAGIVKLYLPIKKILTWRKFPFLKPAEDILAITIAVQIFTAPILVYNFGFVSLVAPFANLLVVWCLPFLIIFSAAGIVLAFIFPSLAAFCFFPAQTLFDYVLQVAEILASLPFIALG